MPQLAIVTCIKDEGEDLVEWLCFHRLVGVSRFIIYDNESSDATRRILDAVPFRDAIEVHYVHDETAQKYAFSDAIRRYRKQLDWVAFIDGDELIVPLADVSLQDHLAELEAAGISGFGIHWRIFGSSGHETRPTGLMTESFTRRGPDGFGPNSHVKSLVQLPKVRKMVTQHFFRVQGAYLLDNGSAPPPDFRGISRPASFTQGLAIHHYIIKSRQQCLKKLARGRPRPSSSPDKFRPPNYFRRFDANRVKDDRAAQIIAPIRDEVLRLRDEIGRD